MESLPEIRTVLIPVDGSSHARKAVLFGAAIAAKFSARIVLLHVLLRGAPVVKLYELARVLNVPQDLLERSKHAAPPVFDFGLAVPANVIRPVPATELLVAVGQGILERDKADLLAQGIASVESVLEDGDPVERILQTATARDAGAIIMGRRGLGAVEGILVGSVSTKVSHLATATVISVT